MKLTVMSKLLIGLFLSVGLIANPAYALDFGKVLEDAAKQKVDEVIQGDEKPAETPAASPAQETNTGATTSSTTEPPANEPAKPAFNWKSPSKEEEIALGREITGSLLGAAPLVKDAALQQYVNKVGRWVANQSERSDLPWKFGVIDSADLNAFAAPGGYVLVTKGLYQKLQNEAQLASVLGHE
ncbi:MAG TPA: M48 family metalloprotease, partial [Methylotenera sp.]|nr:M48 family metalloprotease [Methylotenera sp.]